MTRRQRFAVILMAAGIANYTAALIEPQFTGHGFASAITFVVGVFAW